MHHPKKTPLAFRLLVPLALVLTLVALAGCGGSEAPEPAAGDATSAATEVAVSATEPADAPTQEPEPEPTDEPAPTESAPTESAPAEEETLQLDDRTAGLDQLSSYKLKWSAAWEGEENGKTRQVSWDWTQEYTAEPRAEHWVFASTDSNQNQTGTFETYMIGDTSYILTDDGTERKCVSVSSEDMNQDRSSFNPSLLGSLNDAKYAGEDTVNGIAARRYTYDQTSTSLLGSGKTTGEVWVAIDGGYVVKEDVQWEGGAGFLGTAEGIGKGHWTWELSDANADFTISPPEGCESAAGGLPIMADATEKSSLGDMLMYKTKAKPADVIEFYKTEMEAAGWTLDGEPTTTEGFSQVSFTQDGQQAQLMVTSDENGTQVIINVTK